MLPLGVVARGWALVSFVVLALPLGVTGQDRIHDRAEARAARALAAVERRVARGEHGGALRLLRRALGRDHDLRLARRLCTLLAREGALEEAGATECGEALGLSLADPRALERTEAERADAEATLLTVRLVLLGPAGALADAVTRLRPQSEPLAAELRRIGAAAIEADDLPTAEASLARAREVLPQSVEVLSDLGLVLLARGRPAEAARVLSGALARRPGDLELTRDLASAWVASGEPSRAAVLLTDALRITSLTPAQAIPLELDAARAFTELGEHALALDHAERAAALDPTSAEAWVLASSIHLARGEPEAARAALDEGLRRDPESASARRARAALGD